MQAPAMRGAKANCPTGARTALRGQIKAHALALAGATLAPCASVALPAPFSSPAPPPYVMHRQRSTCAGEMAQRRRSTAQIRWTESVVASTRDEAREKVTAAARAPQTTRCIALHCPISLCTIFGGAAGARRPSRVASAALCWSDACSTHDTAAPLSTTCTHPVHKRNLNV